MKIVPVILPSQDQYYLDLWGRSECYKFYVQERRKNCNFMEIMNLWLRVPHCWICLQSDPLAWNRMPDIRSKNWEDDISWKLGEETLEIIKDVLELDPDFAIQCKRCGSLLRPWEEDEVYVVKYHLEEHYDIPLAIKGKIYPAETIRNQIIKLYDHKCFGCNSESMEFHVDHVLPRSKGGDAAFRNLQPLCESCGNLKGNKLPEEVDVYSDIYFGPYPSDGYEGLFW